MSVEFEKDMEPITETSVRETIIHEYSSHCDSSNYVKFTIILQLLMEGGQNGLIDTN